jgi:hypothetical protein
MDPRADHGTGALAPTVARGTALSGEPEGAARMANTITARTSARRTSAASGQSHAKATRREGFTGRATPFL